MKKWEADKKAAQEKVDYWNKVAEANEMQEADLENVEKGEKAVEPVGETDSSTLSQTSDQVVDNAPGNGSAEENEVVGPFGRIYRQFKGRQKRLYCSCLARKRVRL